MPVLAQRGGVGRAVPIFNLSSRKGWVVSATPRVFTAWKGPIWMGVDKRKSPVLLRRPARSELSYWRCYPSPYLIFKILWFCNIVTPEDDCGV